MDGILLVNKPIGLTSRDVVNLIGKKFNTKKIGHAGSLDPFASGVLILTIGKGTKTTTYFENLDKQYEASLLLGIKTDSLDCTGNVVETAEVPHITSKDIEEVFLSLKGDLKQTPPMFSALKHKGKPLYKYAREGIDIERKERDIKIYDINLISFKDNLIYFHVRCSKGTYIRTLGEQIAEKLSSIGHLINLTRTAIGDFTLDSCKDIDDILESDIISLTDALKHIKHIVVDEEKTIKDIKDGKIMQIDEVDDLILFVTGQKEAISIYIKLEDGRYVCQRGLF